MNLDQHLTEDQLTDCMLHGTPPPEFGEHLHICESCSHRLIAATDEFVGPVTDFSSASLAWSEARPEVSLRAEAARQSRRSASAPLGWALAFASLLVVAIPAWQHEHRAPVAAGSAEVSTPAAQDSAAQDSAAQDSLAQIESDDQMLARVNVALADEGPSPFREYNLPQSSALDRNVESRTR